MAGDRPESRTATVEEPLRKLTLKKPTNDRRSRIKRTEATGLCAEVGRKRSGRSACQAAQLLRRPFRYSSQVMLRTRQGDRIWLGLSGLFGACSAWRDRLMWPILD